MSRRKIQRKRNKNEKMKLYQTSFVHTQDPDTGEIAVHHYIWEMNHDDMEYMPIYGRAHELMPEPRSMLMDPNEYLDELQPAIQTLARVSNETSTDDLLRAIAILGHTPNDDALKALSQFVYSNHSLVPVARLALGECSGLYSIFKIRSKAC